MIRLDVLADAGDTPRSTLQGWLRKGYIEGTRTGPGRGKATLLTKDEALIAVRAMLLRRGGRLRFLGNARFQIVGRSNPDLEAFCVRPGPRVLSGAAIVELRSPLGRRREAEVRQVIRKAIQRQREAA